MAYLFNPHPPTNPSEAPTIPSTNPSWLPAHIHFLSFPQFLLSSCTCCGFSAWLSPESYWDVAASYPLAFFPCGLLLPPWQEMFPFSLSLPLPLLLSLPCWNKEPPRCLAAFDIFALMAANSNWKEENSCCKDLIACKSSRAGLLLSILIHWTDQSACCHHHFLTEISLATEHQIYTPGRKTETLNITWMLFVVFSFCPLQCFKENHLQSVVVLWVRLYL